MNLFSNQRNRSTVVALKMVYVMGFCLLLLFAGGTSVSGSTLAYSQQVRKISGIVKNTQGEPVIGANILEKGTSNGTITDINGLFTLRVSPNAVIKVSYIGYTEQEIAIGNRNRLDIVMTEDTRLIDEVVVVGYGKQKKATVTGSIAQVSGTELKQSPAANLSNS